MALFIRFLFFSSFVSFLNTYTCWASLPASSPFHRRVAKSHAWTSPDRRHGNEGRTSSEVFKPTNLTPYSEIWLIRTSYKGKNTVLEKQEIFVAVTKIWVYDLSNTGMAPYHWAITERLMESKAIFNRFICLCDMLLLWSEIMKQRTGNFSLGSKLKEKDVALIVMSRSWDKK